MDELERLAAKYYLYLHFRDPKAMKWVSDPPHGIATGMRFSENQIEKFLEEGNSEGARKAFEELVKQDNLAAKFAAIETKNKKEDSDDNFQK